MTHSLKQLKTLLSPASCMLVPFKFNSLDIKISHLGLINLEYSENRMATDDYLSVLGEEPSCRARNK